MQYNDLAPKPYQFNNPLKQSTHHATTPFPSFQCRATARPTSDLRLMHTVTKRVSIMAMKKDVQQDTPVDNMKQINWSRTPKTVSKPSSA